MISKTQLILIILQIVFILQTVYSKSIEDPVARHDSNMCGTYLCKSFPLFATEYLENGCEGEFKEFINNKVSESKSTQLLLKEYYNEKINLKLKDYINNSVLFVMIIGGIIISSTTGYLYGYYENLPKNKHGIDEF